MSWNLLLFFRRLWCLVLKATVWFIDVSFRKYCHQMYLSSTHVKQQTCVGFISVHFKWEKKCAFLSLCSAIKKWELNTVQFFCYWNQLWEDDRLRNGTIQSNDFFWATRAESCDSFVVVSGCCCCRSMMLFLLFMDQCLMRMTSRKHINFDGCPLTMLINELMLHY